MVLAAAAVTIAAPTGSTSPSGLTGVFVHNGDDWTTPEHIYIGVRYTVYARAVGSGEPLRVNFYDNSAFLGSTLAVVVHDPISQTYATVNWVPTSAGTHVLSIEQGNYESSSNPVQVEPTPTGTTPVA